MPRENVQVTAGPAAGSQIPFSGDLIIGRADGLLGEDGEVSRRHARIYRAPTGGLMVTDLGSTNGTFLNGRRIGEPEPLGPGDRVQVGESTIQIVAGDPIQPREGTVSAPPQPEAAPPPFAGVGTLFAAGRRLDVPRRGLTIGREQDNVLALDQSLVSRHHARIDLAAAGYYLTDLGSSNGTFLNGERLQAAARWLASGDQIRIGEELLRFVAGGATNLVSRDDLIGAPAAPNLPSAVVMDRDRLTIGRDPGNDVVLDDPNISRMHAELVRTQSGVEVCDLASRNGTRLDGAPITRATLRIGSEVGIGPFRFVFDGEALRTRDDRGALRLDAEGVSVTVSAGRRRPAKQILEPTSIQVNPGEFVAIIGESGSGKSTLIKALAGVAAPTQGHVTVSGEPVSLRQSEIGYVPQDEIVHSALTVTEALRYAARLRLPRDSTTPEIDAAVREVITELALEEHAPTRIGSLSGGQRKRVGVGTELVNRPGLLFLDEATTGLDPGLERRMMELMRRLASNRRAVITITHATKNLGLCDKVAVMGRGGRICFFGAPRAALDFFGASDYDGIYAELEEHGAEHWQQRWQRHPAVRRRADTDAGVTPARLRQHFARTKSDRPVLDQAQVLAARYARIMLRDRRNLLVLCAQVPVLGLAVALLYPSNAFQSTSHQPDKIAGVLFAVITIAVWIGSIDAAREIVKERTVRTRERAVGVGTTAYLLSKTTVLFGLASLQALVLSGVVFSILSGGTATGAVVALIVLTTIVGVSMGLFISAAVSNENQATSFIPLALIPQLLLAGQLVPLKDIQPPLTWISDATFSRWALEGAGSASDLTARFAAAGHAANGFGASYFSLAPGFAALILIAFLAVFLAGAAWRLGASRH